MGKLWIIDKIAVGQWLMVVFIVMLPVSIMIISVLILSACICICSAVFLFKWWDLKIARGTSNRDSWHLQQSLFVIYCWWSWVFAAISGPVGPQKCNLSEFYIPYVLQCVLAGIILFALKGTLKQVKDFPIAWKHSRKDGFIWMVTFMTVVLVDISTGLAIGIIVSLGVIIRMSQGPYVHSLGNLPNTDIYIESDRYNKVGS